MEVAAVEQQGPPADVEDAPYTANDDFMVATRIARFRDAFEVGDAPVDQRDAVEPGVARDSLKLVRGGLGEMQRKPLLVA